MSDVVNQNEVKSSLAGGPCLLQESLRVGLGVPGTTDSVHSLRHSKTSSAGQGQRFQLRTR